MKKQFNLFDGLFLLALFFKLSGTGPAMAWLEVFAPYILETVVAIIGAFATLLNWKDRLKFWFWKSAMRVRVRRAGDLAKSVIDAHIKATERARNTRENLN